MLNIENKLTLAREEVALRNFESAIEYIDEVLEEYPSDKEALWQRIHIPFLHYIDIICRDFKIEKEIALSESFEIDFHLTSNAKKITDLKNECLFYLKTYFRISSERERNDLFTKMESSSMQKLYINDLNYLLELDNIVIGANAFVSKLILEYCNKVYLNNLKKRQEIPEGILNLKSYAESNLKSANSAMFMEVNENFTDTKIWMEKILAEDEEQKKKQKLKSEKAAKSSRRIKPVYIFSFLIVLMLVVFFILYKILQKYT